MYEPEINSVIALHDKIVPLNEDQWNILVKTHNLASEVWQQGIRYFLDQYEEAECPPQPSTYAERIGFALMLRGMPRTLTAQLVFYLTTECYIQDARAMAEGVGSFDGARPVALFTVCPYNYLRKQVNPIEKEHYRPESAKHYWQGAMDAACQNPQGQSELLYRLPYAYVEKWCEINPSKAEWFREKLYGVAVEKLKGLAANEDLSAVMGTMSGLQLEKKDTSGMAVDEEG